MTALVPVIIHMVARVFDVLLYRQSQTCENKTVLEPGDCYVGAFRNSPDVFCQANVEKTKG